MDIGSEVKHQTMGYDRTATMFSPDGRLLQVEYAEKAVRSGSSSVGMICEDGVFILSDRRIEDKLIIPSSANKIHEIDSHLISSMAGVSSDARVLVARVRILSQQHRITYDSPIEPELVTKEISTMKQKFTQYGGARPFGVYTMLGGINLTNGKPELFVINVTGNYYSYYAAAIGKDDDKIKEKLREKYEENLTIKKGVKIALNIFKEIQGNKFDSKKFELNYINLEDKKIVKKSGEEIKNF